VTAPGDLLAGRYRIVGRLGSGGMATVFHARDERLDRDVAVKILLPNHAGDPVLAGRFEREARSLAAAAHPGVVAVYDVDAGDAATGREPFFVMELCPGGSLANRMADGRRLPPDELVPILVSVADGLDDLHRRGFVHRDLKPQNVLLTADRAKLADFGLARQDEDPLSDLTAPGTAVGTLAYLAPEVLQGERAGSAADVYALGVIAFAGLTGRLPRPATSLAELVAGSMTAPPRVSEAAPELGPSFDDAVAAGLAPAPADRPDALGFGAMLTTALGRWSRAGGAGRPLAAASAIPAPTVETGARQPADEITTATAIPLERTLHAQPIDGAPSAAVVPGRRDGDGPGVMGRAAMIAVVAMAAFLITLAIGTILGWNRAPSVAGQPSAAAGAAASASSLPSAAASRPPSPPVTPTPTVDPALAALDAFDRALAAARGGNDGLKGKEANDLEGLAGDVRRELATGDREDALTAARRLDRRVRDLTKDQDSDVMAALRRASGDVVSSLSG
jgi:serine/threonine-protein kinase